jgi:hypothetical protein
MKNEVKVHEKITRKFQRTLNRKLWFVPNWQIINFIHTINDYMCRGQWMAFYAVAIYQCPFRKCSGILLTEYIIEYYQAMKLVINKN